MMLSAVLFAIGLFGALARRNIVTVLMSIELMFNAAGINFAAFNRFKYPDGNLGDAAVIFTITIAAVQAAVGLALILAIYKNTRSVYIEKYNTLKG